MTEFDDDGLPMMDVARGDVAASRRIRQNLEILRDGSTDPEFKALLQDVLDGRRSLREVAGGALFDAEITPHMERFGEKWREATSEGQQVVPADTLRKLQRLQAEMAQKMAEIEEKVRELQRLQKDLEEAG
ncbi:hypothetical protein SAMN04489712_109185 [Thermomonospora echinospora]|uniref:Uncharacterized protein n=1 Tax=Thermomonospora echinospora TaxID=1992 RepID=A0A1H6CCQ5_9ACTN|nr:hypothetical protein [Thermomonospora echinospora]SEG70623.1 hypothetical protein SAMN04489712_109185 [Thermomonospora echinospora]